MVTLKEMHCILVNKEQNKEGWTIQLYNEKNGHTYFVPITAASHNAVLQFDVEVGNAVCIKYIEGEWNVGRRIRHIHRLA